MSLKMINPVLSRLKLAQVKLFYPGMVKDGPAGCGVQLSHSLAIARRYDEDVYIQTSLSAHLRNLVGVRSFGENYTVPIFQVLN